MVRYRPSYNSIKQCRVGFELLEALLGVIGFENPDSVARMTDLIYASPHPIVLRRDPEILLSSCSTSVAAIECGE